MPGRRALDLYDGPRTPGIDVSRYQGEIDWHAVATESPARFAIIRTGDGRGTDKRFVENVRAARATGLRLGSYHYFRADRDGATQARRVTELWQEAGGFRVGHDLGIALDLEQGAKSNLEGGVYEGPGDVPLDLVFEEGLEHLAGLGTIGAPLFVYGGQALHWWLAQSRPHLARRYGRFWLWIASYTSGRPRMPVGIDGKLFPWKAWTLHQHTAKGRVPGIKGDVDLNWFRGDSHALREFCAAACLPREEG